MANDQLHQADQLRYEKDKCKDHKAQGGVRNYFAANVSVEQAHMSATAILAFGEMD
jgi:hypothetical protein